MNSALVIAFLFFIGATLGWVLEFFYRNLISHNGKKGKYFINPGFCKGPYLPIYGVGLSVMFVITELTNKYLDNPPVIIIILGITVAMTLIEFVGGVFLLKVMNMRLWDYRDRPGNVMGVICPLFTVIWGSIGAFYYLFIHPECIDWIRWLANNLAFSFFIGLFYGVFIIDMFTTAREAIVIKNYGDEKGTIVKYEEFKSMIQEKRLEAQKKIKFFNQTFTDNKTLKNILEELEGFEEDKAEAFKRRFNKEK